MCIRDRVYRARRTVKGRKLTVPVLPNYLFRMYNGRNAHGTGQDGGMGVGTAAARHKAHDEILIELNRFTWRQVVGTDDYRVVNLGCPIEIALHEGAQDLSHNICLLYTSWAFLPLYIRKR